MRRLFAMAFAAAVMSTAYAEKIEVVNLVSGGDLEGENTCVAVKTNVDGNTAISFDAPVAEAGKTGKGVTVVSAAGAKEDYDAQMWIVFDENLESGTQVQVSFDYKASAAVSIGTQCHNDPGAYMHWQCIGDINFTTEWQTWSGTLTVPNEANGMKSIAFNLSKDKENDITFCIDNVSVSYEKVVPEDNDPIVKDYIWNAPLTYTGKSNTDGAFVEYTNSNSEEGISVVSAAGAKDDWDAQFWIVLPNTLPAGTKYNVSFERKASSAVSGISTQSHAAPGNYLHWAAIGDVSFNTEWETFTWSGSVESAANNMRSIAFNLAKDRANDVTYSFRNVKVTMAAKETVPEGDVYIQNVETGLYLGGANDWGTKASGIKYGQNFTIARLEDGTYTLDSHISNGGESHYLGSNGYVDAKATDAGDVIINFDISPVAPGVFTIKNGDDNLSVNPDNGNRVDFAATEANAQWRFVTREQVLASAAAATSENPVDLTLLVKDANFGRNNQDISAWDIQPSVGGDNANMNAEKWGGNSQEFDSHQTVAGLPNGRYMIMAQGYYRYNNTPDNTNDIAAATHADGTEKILSFLYANDKQVGLKSIADEEAVAAYGKMPFSQGEASAAFNLGLYDNVLNNVKVTDGTLTLGIKKTAHEGCDWTVWDNFRIFYLGEAPAFVLGEPELSIANGAEIDPAEWAGIEVGFPSNNLAEAYEDLIAEDNLQANVVVTLYTKDKSEPVVDRASAPTLDEAFGKLLSRTALAYDKAYHAEIVVTVEDLTNFNWDTFSGDVVYTNEESPITVDFTTIARIDPNIAVADYDMDNITLVVNGATDVEVVAPADITGAPVITQNGNEQIAKYPKVTATGNKVNVEIMGISANGQTADGEYDLYIPGNSLNIDGEMYAEPIEVVIEVENNEVKAVYFRGDNATGLNGLMAEGSKTIVTVNGMKVNAAVKGINIINGKKVLVK